MKILIKCNPPRHTAQASNKILKNKEGKYFVGKKTSSKAHQTQNELAWLLYPYRPESPLQTPLKLEIRWVYPYRKTEPKKNRVGDIPCDTRPDVDNLCKLLLDIMTRIGFWVDDSQIYSLKFTKLYGADPRIEIDIQEN